MTQKIILLGESCKLAQLAKYRDNRKLMPQLGLDYIAL